APVPPQDPPALVATPPVAGATEQAESPLVAGPLRPVATPLLVATTGTTAALAPRMARRVSTAGRAARMLARRSSFRLPIRCRYHRSSIRRMPRSQSSLPPQGDRSQPLRP